MHGAGHSALYPNLRMPFQTSIRHGSVPVVLRTRSIVIAAPERNITEVAAGDIFAALSARDPRGAQRATAAPENITDISQRRDPYKTAVTCYIT